MNARRPVTRRNVVRGVAAAAAFALPRFSRAQSAARVIVIGGGFGGATCARALRRIAPNLQVTLIEPNRIFTACPFSNEVIAGLRPLEAQQFGYDRIAAEGVTVIAQAAVTVDPHQRVVGLAGGASLGYDRLVLSPGIDLRFDALTGYDEAAAARMPHAWKAGEQTTLLRQLLEAMDDGGRKPRSKILILDAKDAFPQQRLFENAWQELYPGMIERVSLSQGGRVTAVDVATRTIVTDFGNYTSDVANVIPPQQAARIAAIAGTVDNTGWCPIDPVSFASKLVPDIHVIGDAGFGGTIPKSASAASAQGKACAEAIVRLIAGQPPDAPKLTGVCYNTVAPGYAFSQSGVYQARDGQFAEAEALATSPVDAPRELRAHEAIDAQSWFKTVTVDAFG